MSNPCWFVVQIQQRIDGDVGQPRLVQRAVGIGHIYTRV